MTTKEMQSVTGPLRIEQGEEVERVSEDAVHRFGARAGSGRAVAPCQPADRERNRSRLRTARPTFFLAEPG